MENIEKNEIITTEAIEDITEATSNNGSVLKTVGIIGVGLAGAALLTKFVLLPTARKVKRTIQRKKAAKQMAEKTDAEEIDLTDIDLDDIPDVE